MFNNIPVNGWPQLKDLDKVQPILNELDKIESWRKTVKEMTFTGSELMITNALKLPARSLVTNVYPIQEGEGDPSPTNIRPISGRSSITVTSKNADESETTIATITLGQTVYGGEINWNTGECIITHGAVDLGSLTWARQGTTVFRFQTTVSDAKGSGDNTQKGNIISSIYPTDSWSQVTNINGITAVAVNAAGGIIVIQDNTYTDADSFKTAVTGQTLCYELAAPIELTLTPTELELLKGFNRVTTTDGAATITLKALTGANWS